MWIERWSVFFINTWELLQLSLYLLGNPCLSIFSCKFCTVTCSYVNILLSKMKFLIAIVLYRIERKLTPLLKTNLSVKKKKKRKWLYHRTKLQDSLQSPSKFQHYFSKNKKSILKFIWKHKRPQIPKVIMSNMNDAVGITILDSNYTTES